MANTAYIVSSAGTTQLQDAGNGVDFTYTPMSTSISDEFVTETGRLRIRKTTTAAMGTVVANVARALNEAQLYNTYGGGTAPVYMYFQPNGYADAYRTEIITGNLALQDGNMDTTRVEGAGTKFFEFDLGFTRRNWFEGPETALTLSNPNGTATEVYIDFFNDGGTVAGRKRYNYVDVEGTSIQGNLLAPVVLTINTNGTFSLWNVYAHVGWDNYSLKTTFEAESGHQVGGGGTYVDRGTAQAAGTASNGTIIHTATENIHYLTGLGFTGGLYEIYARVMGNGTATTPYNANLYAFTGGFDAQYSGTTAITRQSVNNATGTPSTWSFVDLGPLYLPTIYPSAGTVVPTASQYFGVASDVNIKFDFLYVLPMNQRLNASIGGSGRRVDNAMVIDTVLGGHYGNDTSGGAVPLYTKGNLNIMPSKNQRIHFLDMNKLTDRTDGTVMYRINISYRPRRLTI
jgi:hypothetical protein